MKTTIDLVNDDIWVLTRIFLEKNPKKQQEQQQQGRNLHCQKHKQSRSNKVSLSRAKILWNIQIHDNSNNLETKE